MPEAQVRHIQAADRESLYQFCQNRTYPLSAFVSPDENKRLTLDALERILRAIFEKQGVFGLVAHIGGAISGYLFGQVRQKESITKEWQCQVLELVAPSQECFHKLATAAAQIAKEEGDAYLVYQTFESQVQEKTWAKAQGFQTELLRSFMSVTPEEPIPSHENYQLRRASEKEMSFIVGLVANHSPAYVPAHRVVDAKQIQSDFAATYKGLSARDKKKVPLLLVRRSTQELIGYVILIPGRLYGDRGPTAMYIYDVAIGPAGHGLGLSRWIALGSKQLMQKMGGGILYGDISPLNRLSLGANLALGGRIDSRRWGLKL